MLNVPGADGLPLRRRLLLGGLALVLAAAAWLPLAHVFFAPDAADAAATRVAGGIPDLARALAARQLEAWGRADLRDPEVRRMRESNAEWDFMGRTFLVLALANMSLREPAGAPRYLAAIDDILADTLRLEREQGIRHFLMGYARRGAFHSGVDRSLFLDGEIALMVGARRLIAERDDYRPLLDFRVNAMLAYMQRSPVLCGESYPDECWTFCNAVALAAMRMHEVLDGADHSAFRVAWLASARRSLVDPKTGLLISSFAFDGTPGDGPEGSSIWMVAHCLAVVDPDFARDQYDRARRELGREVLGFGYAAEWPASWRGAMDIDSGPVVPFVDLSAGSSGMAFLGAATFGDEPYLRALRTTLDFAAFPLRRDGGLRYCASNQVGDAVLLYASVMGPLWQKVNDAPARR